MKRWIRNILGVLLILLIASNAYAVGTVTGAASRVVDPFTNKFKMVKVTLTCTADAAAGTYPATIINTLTGVKAYPLTGLYLYMVQAYPGSVAPTDASDLTITMDGVDILGGNGTNLIDATSYTSCLAGTAGGLAPVPITGNITANLTQEAVATNSAIVYIILTFVSE